MRREFFSIWDLNGDYITAVAMQVVSGLSVRVGNAVRKANRTMVTRGLQWYLRDLRTTHLRLVRWWHGGNVERITFVLFKLRPAT